MPEEGIPCMNCYLMEIGEADPNVNVCEKCGKPPSNMLLDTF